MANPKSGGKDGEFVLSTFRKLLNPIQVIDLSETPPESGLEICRMLEDLHCRLLVCGGDGTVGWVLSTLDKLQLVVSTKFVYRIILIWHSTTVPISLHH